MLKLIALKSCIATLQYQTDHTLSILDWDQSTQKISPFRYMNFTVSAIHNDVAFLEGLLLKRPKARIVHILSHEQRKGFHLITESDGEPHIDDFGLEVYIAQEVDWFGEIADIDERFENALPF